MLDQVHEFLAARYRRDRFEGRNGVEWGADYSMCVARSTLADLIDHGVSLISHHESANGQPVYFDAQLRELSADEWRATIKGEAGNRTGESSTISVAGGSPGASLTVPTQMRAMATQREAVSGEPA